MAGIAGQRSSKVTELPARYSETLIEELDGRYRVTKELKDRAHAIFNDLGGLDTLSYLQRSLVKRYTFLEISHEQDEARLARGEADVDLGRHVQRLNSLIGLARTLGIQRRQKRINGGLPRLLEDS
jgi:hypothetical protein